MAENDDEAIARARQLKRNARICEVWRERDGLVASLHAEDLAVETTAEQQAALTREDTDFDPDDPLVQNAVAERLHAYAAKLRKEA